MQILKSKLSLQCFISKRIPNDSLLQEIIERKVNLDLFLQENKAKSTGIGPFNAEKIRG